MNTCPIHGTPLLAKNVAGRKLRQCTTCRGLWLPAASVAAALGQPAIARPRDTAQPTSLRCPDDGASLVAVFHHKVEIDLCTACGGVWLDHGELERILAARRKEQVAEAAGDAVDGVDLGIDLVDLGGDAVGAVFEFIGDCLNGL